MSEQNDVASVQQSNPSLNSFSLMTSKYRRLRDILKEHQLKVKSDGFKDSLLTCDNTNNNKNSSFTQTKSEQYGVSFKANNSSPPNSLLLEKSQAKNFPQESVAKPLCNYCQCQSQNSNLKISEKMGNISGRGLDKSSQCSIEDFLGVDECEPTSNKVKMRDKDWGPSLSIVSNETITQRSSLDREVLLGVNKNLTPTKKEERERYLDSLENSELMDSLLKLGGLGKSDARPIYPHAKRQEEFEQEWQRILSQNSDSLSTNKAIGLMKSSQERSIGGEAKIIYENSLICLKTSKFEKSREEDLNVEVPKAIASFPTNVLVPGSALLNEVETKSQSREEKQVIGGLKRSPNMKICGITLNESFCSETTNAADSEELSTREQDSLSSTCKTDKNCSSDDDKAKLCVVKRNALGSTRKFPSFLSKVLNKPSSTIHTTTSNVNCNNNNNIISHHHKVSKAFKNIFPRNTSIRRQNSAIYSSGASSNFQQTSVPDKKDCISLTNSFIEKKASTKKEKKPFLSNFFFSHAKKNQNNNNNALTNKKEISHKTLLPQDDVTGKSLQCHQYSNDVLSTPSPQNCQKLKDNLIKELSLVIGSTANQNPPEPHLANHHKESVVCYENKMVIDDFDNQKCCCSQKSDDVFCERIESCKNISPYASALVSTGKDNTPLHYADTSIANLGGSFCAQDENDSRDYENTPLFNWPQSSAKVANQIMDKKNEEKMASIIYENELASKLTIQSLKSKKALPYPFPSSKYTRRSNVHSKGDIGNSINHETPFPINNNSTPYVLTNCQSSVLRKAKEFEEKSRQSIFETRRNSSAFPYGENVSKNERVFKSLQVKQSQIQESKELFPNYSNISNVPNEDKSDVKDTSSEPGEYANLILRKSYSFSHHKHNNDANG